LLGEVVAERDGLNVDERLKPKVVVKVAPDLDESELEDIAGAVRMSKVDGVIVSNTTVKRDGLGLKSGKSRLLTLVVLL
jgi:dihydroorotate dehydrogenase